MNCMPIVGANWGDSSPQPLPGIRTVRTDSGHLTEVPILPDPKSVKSPPRRSREGAIFAWLSVKTRFRRDCCASKLIPGKKTFDLRASFFRQQETK